MPGHLAGVSGPCPVCGQTITSPQASVKVAPPMFSPGALASRTTGGAGLLPETAPAPSGGVGPGPVLPDPASLARHLTPLGQPQPTAMPQTVPSAPVMPGLPPMQVPQGMPGAGGMLGGGNPGPVGGGMLGGMPAMPAASPPSAAPAWQQPGLGQALLGGAIPPAGPLLTPAPEVGMQGGFLSGPAAAAPASPAWNTPPAPEAAALPEQGGFLPPKRSAGTPPHSSLIPGAPTLPNLANRGDTVSGSLLGRAVPETMQMPAPGAVPPTLPQVSQPLPTSQSRTSRPLKRQRKSSSNIFMFALSVIFLLGFASAAIWMFREPLLEVAQRYIPMLKGGAAEVGEPEMPMMTTTSPAQPTEPVAPKPDLVADVPNQEEMPKTASTGFDPDEAATPGLAQPTQQEMANESRPEMTPPLAAVSEPRSEAAEPGMKEVPVELVAGPEAGSKTHVQIEVPEEAKPAAEALMKFLTARSLDERIALSLAADTMRPLMERYYEHQPAGPVHVDAVGLVRFDPKPQMGGGAHAVFGLESKEWEYPIPVMLEEGKEGFKVDWLSFVEFKDRLLEGFFETYQEGSARFHVGMTRTHYFDDRVPNSGSKDAFRISPAPPNPWNSLVFLDKDSALARDLRDRVPWGAQVWAIVELEWVKLGNLKWVQLAAVPQLNWYSVPANGSSRAFPNTIPTEAQRAVPVGR